VTLHQYMTFLGVGILIGLAIAVLIGIAISYGI